MSRPNVSDWQYLGVDTFTRFLEGNGGRTARKGHLFVRTQLHTARIVVRMIGYATETPIKTCNMSLALYTYNNIHVLISNVHNPFPTAKDGEVIKKIIQHLCHHGDTIFHTNSS